MNSLELKRKFKEVREEIAYIGRYTDGISPKLDKYRQLQERKEVLRKELKNLKKVIPLE